MEPDVPDTRKMLIRVRRKQSMAAIAARYHVSLWQLRAWNKTHRSEAMPGQVIVLHVPVGRVEPAEPGPQRLATAAAESAHVERVSAHAAEAKPRSRHGMVAKGRVRTTIGKTAAHEAKPARAKTAATKSTRKGSKVVESQGKSERKSKQKS